MSNSFAELQIKPTTTLANETSNNTSAADSFAGQTNGNIGASNVSKVPIRSLLYDGSSTKIYAHVVPWFGKSSHVAVGYSSQDAEQVRREVADMVSRGIDGAIVDWYGPTSYEDLGTKLFMQAAQEQPGFELIVELEHGAVLWHSCYPTCTATDAVIQLSTTISQTFFPSSAYARNAGRPILMEFAMETLSQAVDWNRVQAAVPGNPIWIHRNNSGFSKTQSGGAFSWLKDLTLDTFTAGWDGTSYLDSFYQTAATFPGLLTYGSVYKGFNDTIASWAPPGGRHIDQQCGQTWLATFDHINRWYSTSNPLHAMQLVTWNDYEEGTELESGIDNCLSLTSWLDGTTLRWSLTGQGSEKTIHHYSVFISADGQNLMPLAELNPGNYQLDLTRFDLAPGSYTFYVKATGQPSIRNLMSEAVLVVASSSSVLSSPAVGSPNNLKLSLSPAMLQVARGQSGQMTLTVAASSGLSADLAFGCSDLPANVTCSFTPNRLAAGTSAGSATLTISAPPAANAWLNGAGSFWKFGLQFGLLGAVLVTSTRRRRTAYVFMLTIAALVLLAACGASRSTQSAEKGTHTITVWAAAGSERGSTTATLVIH